MAIALRVCPGGVDIPDAKLLAEVSKEVEIKLSLVAYQSSWDPKSCNDILLYKVLRVLGDGGLRFGFDPLGEIIGGYYKPPLILWSSME